MGLSSKSILNEATLIIRDKLLKDSKLTISGLGTLNVESIPSASESQGKSKYIVHPPRKRVLLEGDPSLPTDPSFVSDLASKLQKSTEETTAILHLLIEEILSQTPVHLPEIGIISRNKNKLEFAPSPELERFLAGPYGKMISLEIKKEQSPPPVQRPRLLRWAIALPVIILSIVAVVLIQNNFLPFQQTMDESDALLPGIADSLNTVTSIDNSTAGPTDHAIENTLRIQPEPTPDVSVITLADDPEPPVTETPLAQDDSGVPLLDIETGGYTLIIGSFDTAEQALVLVRQYREVYPEVPVDILRNTDNTLHRVAVGQVPTIPAAEDLKARLTELPADAWVLNIQNKNI